MPPAAERRLDLVTRTLCHHIALIRPGFWVRQKDDHVEGLVVCHWVVCQVEVVSLPLSDNLDRTIDPAARGPPVGHFMCILGL